MMKRVLVGVSLLFLLISSTTTGFPGPITNLDGDDFEDIYPNDEIEQGKGFAYDMYQNSGDLMFVESGNNDGQDFNNGSVEQLVENWLIASDDYSGLDRTTFELSLSTNVSFSGWIWDADGTDGTLVMNAKTLSGEWQVVPETSRINFYAIKAANAYAMYFVGPLGTGDRNGSWSTFDLWAAGHPGSSLELSHFTAYNPVTTKTPEPATLVLFSTGIAGLSALRSRRKTRQ